MPAARNRAVWGLILLALAGSTATLITTRGSVGVSPDSVDYLTAAENLSNGRGLKLASPTGELVPMTHYPPLLPALLSVMRTLGIDPLIAASWLNAALFAGSILLAGVVLRAYTGSAAVGLLGSLLMLVSPSIFKAHSMAWTEPLFLFFGLLGLVLLAAYCNGLRYYLIVTASVCIGIAFMARYVGAALVGTGLVGLWMLSASSWRRKLRDSIILFAVSCIALAVWLIRNHSAAGGAVDRPLAFHPMALRDLRGAASTLSIWLFPQSIPAMIRGALLVAALAWGFVVIMLLLRRIRSSAPVGSQPRQPAALPGLLLIYIVVYCGFLVTSKSLFDASTPVSVRVMSPVFMAGLLLLGCILRPALHLAATYRSLRAQLLTLLVLLSASYAARTAVFMVRSNGYAPGYADMEWRQCQVMEQVRALAPDTLIYSDAYDAIRFLTGRSALALPRKFNPYTARTDDSYAVEVSRMAEQLTARDGVIVVVNRVVWRPYSPSEEELREQLSLRPLVKTPDGTVYALGN